MTHASGDFHIYGVSGASTFAVKRRKSLDQILPSETENQRNILMISSAQFRTFARWKWVEIHCGLL